jgi:uncharacterized membrane protein YdjX (TVP38/TMEM64 family)
LPIYSSMQVRLRTRQRISTLKNFARTWTGRLSIIGISVGAILLVWKFAPVDRWLTLAVWHMFDFGGWGLLIYFLLYVLAVQLAFPTTLLNVGAGILFSFWTGAAVALVAGFAAAISGFLLVRYVAGERIRSRLRRLPRYDEVMQLMESAGLQVVFLMRLNPFIPASLKNYGFSLAGVPLRTYMLGTALGQTPVTLAHVYLGWAGGLTMMIGTETFEARDYAFIGVGVVLSLALLGFISWYGRKTTLGRA